MLTPDQKQQFDQDGFLVLENAFAAGELEKVRKAALAIVDEFDIDRHRTVFKTTDRDAGRDDYFFDSAEAVHCFLEEGALGADGELIRPKELAINKMGHAMHDLVPEFGDFCRLPLIGQVLRDLGYSHPTLWQTMYIFKQPGIGGEVRWHQDASYLITSPPNVIGMWIAMEDATRDNGCLWMIPGQHRSPLREIFRVDWESRTGTLTTLDETPWQIGTDPVAMEVPAGSAVLFHDHMPHYSSQNTSDKSRHALTLHLSDRADSWLAENWLQRPGLGHFLL
ncbi:MAG: phytanoyl-CoA dioxygenase family protein [Xanthomonadales bacterium]|nr:phytanoyl-CoA dioxygenase family protein [Xanthomonadales bacterium]